jgi:hypothetical protein
MWSNCTLIKATLISLCSFTKPFFNIYTPSAPLFHEEVATENISSVITVVLFTYNCAFCFSILMSFGSQACSLVWYTSTHGVQPYTHIVFSTPAFCSCLFILVNTHSTEFPYHSWASVYCVSSQVFLGWLVGGACLFCLVVRGQGTLPTCCIKSLVSLLWTVVCNLLGCSPACGV